MSGESPNFETWVAATVASLRRHGSWCGRIHIQKLLAVRRLLCAGSVPFEFELYRYGPYSFVLDGTIAQMEAAGLLTRTYPKEGYGPQYDLTSFGKSVADSLDRGAATKIDLAAAQFGNKTSKDLELAVTCLWVQLEEGLADDDQIVSRVQDLKPKYNSSEVRDGLQLGREFARVLS